MSHYLHGAFFALALVEEVYGVAHQIADISTKSWKIRHTL
jgi:hypothetical protein